MPSIKVRYTMIEVYQLKSAQKSTREKAKIFFVVNPLLTINCQGLSVNNFFY